MANSQMLQIGGTHGHRRTVVHVVDEDVDPASHVLVRQATLSHNIDHRRLVAKRGKATNLPCRLWSTRNFHLRRDELIIVGVCGELSKLTSFDDRFLSSAPKAGRYSQNGEHRKKPAHIETLPVMPTVAKVTDEIMR